MIVRIYCKLTLDFSSSFANEFVILDRKLSEFTNL